GIHRCATRRCNCRDRPVPLARAGSAPHSRSGRRPARIVEGVMERVIFACVHNAGRSQMAAALFATMADPARAEGVSAGTEPGDRVHPEVVQVMREMGIDLNVNRPRKLTDELARGASLLVTMGCGEACPYVPGLTRDDWPLADPKGRPLEEVRRIRDEI